MSRDLTEIGHNAALAFRGYNITNLGRTPELLAIPAYAEIVTSHLEAAGDLCADVIGKPVDLVARVREASEPTLADYAEAIALVFAAESAQLALVREAHGIDPTEACLAFGYSLGELVAMWAGGLLKADEALRVPLAMAADCASLADGVTMGVLFSRSEPIDPLAVQRLCDAVTLEGAGTIGISAVLSPNSLLVLGQGDTVEKFRLMMSQMLPGRLQLRLNDSTWPPLHTPIVRQKYVPDRASVMLAQMHVSPGPPHPPVASLVTGKLVDDATDIRELLRDWIDRPQRLWDVVRVVLGSATQTIIHVGPEPNVIPATFTRLAENVRQVKSKLNLSGFSARAMAQFVDRPWLSARLPRSAALLRAPQIKQVVLEDWLLENRPQ